MNVNAKTRLIITKENCEQVIIEDVSSISIELELFGNVFTNFFTAQELIKRH